MQDGQGNEQIQNWMALFWIAKKNRCLLAFDVSEFLELDFEKHVLRSGVCVCVCVFFFLSDNQVRMVLYFTGLIYSFMGVSIVAWSSPTGPYIFGVM